MKQSSIGFIVALALVTTQARADISVDFVRVTCVPETGLFEVEYRSLHDGVALGDPKALSRQGFFEPKNLQQRCTLGNVTYQVNAGQGETSNFMCGGSPAMWLAVQRNGKPFIREVSFGYSCVGQPSLVRLTVGDGPLARRQEAQMCFATGQDGQPDVCEWSFGAADFAKKFPLDDDTLRRTVERQGRVMQR